MKTQKRAGLVVLSFMAFISLGMPDGLHGVAWPGIRDTFGLPVDAISLLLIFGTMGYMTASFFNASLVRRLGIGGLLALSCAATGATLLVYGSIALWPLFVLSAFMGGLGAGAIDAGLNTYIAQNYSDAIMQWLHGFFGVGITLGPIIMTLGIRFLQAWRPGYLIVGSAQLLLALLFLITRRKWTQASSPIAADVVADVDVDADDRAAASAGLRVESVEAGKAGAVGEAEAAGASHQPEASIRETIGQLPAILSMLLFFLYTGVELGLGLWSYTLLTESRGIDPTIAGLITGSYWAMFTIGRMLAGLYTRKIPVSRVIMLSIVAAGGGILIVMLNISDIASIVGIAITGFAIAPIFPGLVSDTLNRVGKYHEANTIGMQIAAAGFGSAIIPSLAGVIARRISLEAIPVYILIAIILLLLCFMFTRRPSPSPVAVAD